LQTPTKPVDVVLHRNGAEPFEKIHDGKMSGTLWEDYVGSGIQELTRLRRCSKEETARKINEERVSLEYPDLWTLSK
jgi:hypothetical protein